MSDDQEQWREAGREAFKTLQDALVGRRANLKKVALRIAQGLNAKRTFFFQKDGIVTDSRNCIDFGERRKYAELAVEIFGAKAPTKLEHTGPDGGPVKIEYVNDWRNGNGNH